jgi:hypothetical protein
LLGSSSTCCAVAASMSVPWSCRIIAGVSKRDGSAASPPSPPPPGSVSAVDVSARIITGVSCSVDSPLPRRELDPLPHMYTVAPVATADACIATHPE